jgi:predicted secreted protein
MSFILLTTIIWLVVFFIVLPIGNKMPDNIKLGHADSAPEKHYIYQKLLISLIVSIILALCYKGILHKFPELYQLIKY